MKTQLMIFLSLSLVSVAYGWCGGSGSGCGGCGSSDGCNDNVASACACVDPTCTDPYSCLSYGACCSAFGNIGAMDSSPELNDDTYSYSTADLFVDDSFTEIPAQHYSHKVYSYKGETYSYKGE